MHTPDLTARQLAAVLAVAEYKSFIAAAAQLQTSQPALTRTIKRVEDVLGVRIFERSTRRVQVTSAGREFIAVAQRMLNDLRIVVRGMRELAHEQRGQVVVSSIMSIANGLLPRMVADYRNTRPGVEIQLREGVHGDVIDDIRSGVADIGITYLEGLPDILAAVALGHEAFDLIVPRGHPLARRRTRGAIAVSELEELPLVSMPPDSQTRRILDGAASANGISLNHAVVVSQITTMINFIRAGVGLGVAPSAAVSGLLGERLVRLRLGEPRLSRTVGVVTLKERELTPAASGLLRVVRKTWPAKRH